MKLTPTHSSFWIILTLIAFICLPSKALHYGILDSTPTEIYAAMGWSSVNITWGWFLPSILFLQKSRKKRPLVLLIAYILFILFSAWLTKTGFGYAVIFLAISLMMITTDTLAEYGIMQGDRFLIGTLITTSFTVIIFIAYPIIKLLLVMLFSENNLDRISEILPQPYLFRLLINSLTVSVAVAFFATVLGLIFALYSTRIANKTAFIGKVFSILPMITPPFVVGLGLALIFGRSGYITPFLMDIFGVSQSWFYGFAGIAIAHTLALTPMAFMILEGALKAMPANLEDASSTLKANRYQTLFFITLPLLKPALANAFLVVMVQSLADFSTPFVLGGDYDVVASQIYFFIAGIQPDYLGAGILGSILLIFSSVIFILQYGWIGKKSYITVSGKGYSGKQQPFPNVLKWLIICTLTVWIIFNIILYGGIFYGSFTVNWGVDHSLTLNNYLKLFGQGIDQGGFPSLIQTLLYALISAPIAAVLGLMMAYLLSRKSFKGKANLEFLTLLCFAVPGTVAGVSYLFTFNNAPIYLTGTGAIIVLSMVMRNMPIGMRSAMAGLAQIDKSLDEASFSLKVNSYHTLRYIVLPLLKPALLSALITSFVRSMTTVSAIIFLVAPGTRVATSYILNRVEDGSYGIAIAYGSTLIFIMCLVVGLFNKIINRIFSN